MTDRVLPSAPSPQTTDMDTEPEYPRSFICPITQSLFIDPVIANDGFSYERSAIERWFRTSDLSPVTGLRINRLIIPNRTLRSVIAELYPDRRAPTPSPALSSTSAPEAALTETFAKSREDITQAVRGRIAGPPAAGTVYYGIFEQQFTRGENVAKSRWTLKLEFETLDDYINPPSLTAAILWRKHEQLFEPNMQAFLEHDFATRLLNTVGGSFNCKIRGTYDEANGLIDMYTYEGTNVGIGHYKFLLGPDTIDGCFFLPDFEDIGNPTTQGMGYFRLLLERRGNAPN
jgi:hypothetical protein